MAETLTLSKNEDAHRYELRQGAEQVGFITYQREGEVVELVHTVVEPAHSGQGLARVLVDFALTDIREAGLLVRPTCPYVGRFIERNPVYGSLVAPN